MERKWIPTCKAMQRYCEPYFAAIENWLNYENMDILKSRIMLIESACEIAKTHTMSIAKSFHFELLADCPSQKLLPEVLSSAGRAYLKGADVQIFKNLQSKYPVNMFQKCGTFFQSTVLPLFAGYNEQVLRSSDPLSRKSLIAAILKLFRLSEKSGRAHFTVQLVDKQCGTEHGIVSFDAINSHYNKAHQNSTQNNTQNTDISNNSGCTDTSTSLTVIPCTTLSHAGQQFYDFLVEYKAHRAKAGAGGGTKRSYWGNTSKSKHHNNSSNNNSSSNKRQKVTNISSTHRKLSGANSITADAEFEVDVGLWMTVHSSIGTKVAAYFPDSDNSIDSTTAPDKLYAGEVVAYCPASSKNDKALYHIMWENGDEQDYDAEDMKLGIAHYDILNGFVADHPSVGTKVAAEFAVPVNKKGNKIEMKLFTGVVTKYSPPSDDNLGELFHVLFEDGDECDYSTEDFAHATELYASSANDSRSSSTTVKHSTVKRHNNSRSSSANDNSNSHAITNKHSTDGVNNLNNINVDDKHNINNNSNNSMNSDSMKRSEVGGKSVGTLQSIISHTTTVDTGPDDHIHNEDVEWTKQHPSVGTRIAAQFASRWEPYAGEVTRYAAESAEGEGDQLYHIMFEDGDEEDYFQVDYERGVALYAKLLSEQRKQQSNTSSTYPEPAVVKTSKHNPTVSDPAEAISVAQVSKIATSSTTTPSSAAASANGTKISLPAVNTFGAAAHPVADCFDDSLMEELLQL